MAASARKNIVNIDQLDNKQLEIILRNLPLQTCVRARGVCKKWKALIETNVCANQTTLMLFNSWHDILRYGLFIKYFNGKEVSDLHYSEGKDLIFPGGLTQKKCQFLKRLFPRVQVLVLFYTKFSSHNVLVSLLSGWNATLGSLWMIHMHRSYKLTSAFESMDKLSFPALKHLGVFGDAKYLLKTAINLPQTIGKVNELSLGHYAYHIEPVLQNLGPNITKLRLLLLKFPLETLKKLITSKPNLKHTLTHLFINADTPQEIGVSLKTFKFICSNFLALTHLDILPPQQKNLLDLMPILSQLKQLTELHIRKEEERSYLTIEQSQVGLKFAPMKSVKVFHLYHDLPKEQVPLLARLFPMIEHLSIEPVHLARKEERSFKIFLYKTFVNLKSIKLIKLSTFEKHEKLLQTGRFGRQVRDAAKEMERKTRAKILSFITADFVSSSWEDFYFDESDEDNGYEQTIADEVYTSREDYYYREGEPVPIRGHTTTSRSIGWPTNESTDIMELFRQFGLPTAHIRFE